MVVSRHVNQTPDDVNVTDIPDYVDNEQIMFASNDGQGRLNAAHEPVYTGVSGLSNIPVPGEVADEAIYDRHTGGFAGNEEVPEEPFVVAPGQSEIFDDGPGISGTVGYDYHEDDFGVQRVYED